MRHGIRPGRVGHPENVKELQTLALGLVIVFVDVSTPDWVADPIGWVLVLVALAAVREQLPDYRQVSLAGWTSLALSVVTWPEGMRSRASQTLIWKGAPIRCSGAT